MSAAHNDRATSHPQAPAAPDGRRIVAQALAAERDAHFSLWLGCLAVMLLGALLLPLLSADGGWLHGVLKSLCLAVLLAAFAGFGAIVLVWLSIRSGTRTLPEPARRKVLREALSALLLRAILPAAAAAAAVFASTCL